MFSGLYSRLWVVIVLEIWTWPGNPGWKRKSAGAQCTVRVVRGAIGLADWVAAVSEKRLKYVLNIICFEYNFKCCIKKKGRGCGEDMLRLSRMDEYLGKCPFDNVWFLIVLTHHIHHHFFLRLTQLNSVFSLHALQLIVPRYLNNLSNTPNHQALVWKSKIYPIYPG